MIKYDVTAKKSEQHLQWNQRLDFVNDFIVCWNFVIMENESLDDYVQGETIAYVFVDTLNWQ